MLVAATEAEPEPSASPRSRSSSRGVRLATEEFGRKTHAFAMETRSTPNTVTELAHSVSRGAQDGPSSLSGLPVASSAPSAGGTGEDQQCKELIDRPAPAE